MTLRKLIEHCGINKAYLAKRMGMSRDIFTKKLNESMERKWHLKESEEAQLRKILHELGNELATLKII